MIPILQRRKLRLRGHKFAKKQVTGHTHQVLANPRPVFFPWIPESSCSIAPGLPSPMGQLTHAPCGGLLWGWILFSPGLAGQFLYSAPTCVLFHSERGCPPFQRLPITLPVNPRQFCF